MGISNLKVYVDPMDAGQKCATEYDLGGDAESHAGIFRRRDAKRI